MRSRRSSSRFLRSSRRFSTSSRSASMRASTSLSHSESAMASILAASSVDSASRRVCRSTLLGRGGRGVKVASRSLRSVTNCCRSSLSRDFSRRVSATRRSVARSCARRSALRRSRSARRSACSASRCALAASSMRASRWSRKAWRCSLRCSAHCVIFGRPWRSCVAAIRSTRCCSFSRSFASFALRSSMTCCALTPCHSSEVVPSTRPSSVIRPTLTRCFRAFGDRSKYARRCGSLRAL
mmetsp:Transcript_13512/g.40511  ORF Transcript_13512/g.40511 Transcript_13512/m.40511 type:complete len:240 (-) Transcript_13512:288-1007(-)